MHRQTGEFSIHFISCAQVFRTACFFHRHFAAEQLPYEIKLNGKMIVEWLAIRRVIYL